jgi:hypothetical protein
MPRPAEMLETALEDSLDSPEAIESLVMQICHRAADLGLLLDNNGHYLSQYSRHLRKEPDTEYYEGYFEEPFKE